MINSICRRISFVRLTTQPTLHTLECYHLWCIVNCKMFAETALWLILNTLPTFELSLWKESTNYTNKIWAPQKFVKYTTTIAGASVLVANVLRNQCSLPCSHKPATRCIPCQKNTKVYKTLNKLHNIITYNLQIKYYNSYMFRTSSRHVQGQQSLKVRWRAS
jgi:hypothetical protein